MQSEKSRRRKSMRGSFLWIWMLALCCAVFGANPAKAAPVALAPANAPVVRDYSLSLFTADVVFKSPNVSAMGFWDIKPSTLLAGQPVLDLWYACSTTVRKDLSTMTVSVNGVPVASKRLEPQSSLHVNWQVPLPVEQLRSGTNEIAISVLHRTIDGLCRDIDNEANWFIIRPQTTVKFQTANRQYALRDYPYPFIDEYLSSKINTYVFLSDARPASIATLLELAMQWGRKSAGGPPNRMEVRLETPPAQAISNEVCVGPIGSWLPQQANSYPADTALLQLHPLAGGFWRLLVAGNSDKGLALAANALSHDAYVKTLTADQTFFSAALAEKMSYLHTRKKGLYMLSDMGVDGDVEVAGAFHQEADLYLQRPANYAIGEGSYVELHFRHSKILDQKKSAVTIYINDVPVRAAVLMAENADGGILKAPIPSDQLRQAGWRIRFAFYHDLGIIDCSKRYDDVAWSVIEKETHVYLAPGDTPGELALTDFPSRLQGADPSDPTVTMWLSEHPTPEELTLACKLAYWIGRNHQDPIRWNVVLSPAFTLREAKGAVIALGPNEELAKRGDLKAYLPFFPEGNGTYKIAPWIDLTAMNLIGKDLYQAVSVNGNPVYAFSYAQARSMQAFFDAMLAGGVSLEGQVACSDANGQLVSFKKPVEKTTQYGAVLQGLFSHTVLVYGGLLLAVLLGTVALMLYLRKRS